MNGDTPGVSVKIDDLAVAIPADDVHNRGQLANLELTD